MPASPRIPRALSLFGALWLAFLAGCAEPPPEPRVRLPKGPIDGHYVGQEIWISYGAEEEEPAARRVGRTKAEAKELADALHRRVRQGEDVGELAREHSNAPGAVALGFTSVLPRNPEAPDLRDRWIAAVEVGELTDVVEWNRGFWFARRIALEDAVELERRFEALARTRVSLRAIVLLYDGAWIADKMFVPKYTKDQAVAFAGELLARALGGESFESLAKTYSEDASGEDGGLVTLIRPDGTRTKWLHIAEKGVPGQVLRAAFATKARGVHPRVIVTPRGVYLIDVEARKEVER